jgi:hypothetical protein
MSMVQLVTGIKRNQIVLKKIIQAINLPIEKNLGQYDRKKVIEIDREFESESAEGDDFSKDKTQNNSFAEALTINHEPDASRAHLNEYFTGRVEDFDVDNPANQMQS